MQVRRAPWNVCKNPAVAVAEAAATQLRHYANDFGLTPSGERNVSKRDDGRGDDDANPFAGEAPFSG